MKNRPWDQRNISTNKFMFLLMYLSALIKELADRCYKYTQKKEEKQKNEREDKKNRFNGKKVVELDYIIILLNDFITF